MAFLSSCSWHETKVGEYPLPSQGGGQSLLQQVQSPTTLGAEGANTENPDATTDVPTLPGPMDENNGGSGTLTVPTPTPATPQNSTPPKTAGGSKYPYALPIPNDPTHVLSPYDKQRVRIMRNGKPLPSGTIIKAAGEKDNSKAFIIP